MTVVFDGQPIIEEVGDERRVLRKKNCLGEEPWLGGSEFFESSGADDHRGKSKNACPKQIVGAVIAIAQEPAPCVLSNLKERTARVNDDRH
jgi:hypothetical protein